MKSLVIILLLVSVIFIAIGYIKSNQKCPPPIVEFRYIPKTFKEEQSTAVPILSLYGSMFKNPSPWIKSAGYVGNQYTAERVLKKQ